MSGLIKAIVVLATATAISFPTQPPNKFLSANAGKRRAVSGPASPGSPQYQANQLEYYLTDEGIAYIRPGFNMKVNSVTIGADRKIVVDLSFFDDKNQPLDRKGELTPGAFNPSFIIAWWDPVNRHYTSYITRTAKSPDNAPKPGVTTQQATSESNGTWTDLSLGRATYKFFNALPQNFDPTKVHTLGVQAFRNLTAEIGKNYFDNVEYDFRPDGGKVNPGDAWAKMTDATSCLACHDPETFGFHGSSARRDVKLCVLCHNPQTIDPDTGNNLAFREMIHKIHSPNLLESDYIIYGNAQSVHNYSEVTFPQDQRNCDNCHEGINPAQKPLQSDVYYTKPNRQACGSCHDEVNWTTGANHPAGPQANDDACATCHVADSGDEFDASVKGAHTIPTKSRQLAGLKAQIVSVSDVAAGKAPTITFKITDKNNKAVDGTKLSTFAPISAGPTSSYTAYAREDARSKAVFDAGAGTTTYTFAAKIPEGAKGTWAFSADIYLTTTLKRADGKADITGVRDSAFNPIRYVGLNGAPAAPRRTVVTTAQCNQCHDTLALHGGQRMSVDECVICHNPVSGDKSRRPADQGAEESISFQRMIHRIHSGHELTQDYIVYGFGNTPHHYNEVGYPGDRRNCAKCHAANSHRLPPPSGDPVITLRDWFSPQGPGTASCLGCHDSRDAAAHAFLNTTQFGGQPAEACGACHGANSEWSADKVHAR